ncbi:putative LRR receptor-like serine/threonine-protein kinase [Hordeum vulgare]|nr:putative LRR receptor-like serine/threonine-protein kinase [Hordeum vulgare]
MEEDLALVEGVRGGLGFGRGALGLLVVLLAAGVDGPNGNDEHVGDLEIDLDMGYDEYQQETLDRYWEVMAKTFRSEGEAYMFYNQYAKDRGFSIRRDLKRFSKGSEKVLRLRRFGDLIVGKVRSILHNGKSGTQVGYNIL